MIAVSKTKPVSMLEEAYALEIRDFGENKVQEMCDKYEYFNSINSIKNKEKVITFPKFPN